MGEFGGPCNPLKEQLVDQLMNGVVGDEGEYGVGDDAVDAGDAVDGVAGDDAVVDGVAGAELGYGFPPGPVGWEGGRGQYANY